MIKKTIEYTDYDGNERKEDFYFNLSKAELVEMELGTEGTMTALIKKITDEQDTVRLIELFKDIIKRSYGVKSLDGKRFVKSEESFLEFSQTEAFSMLYMELITDTDAAVNFVNGIMPSDLQKAMKEEQNKGASIVPVNDN